MTFSLRIAVLAVTLPPVVAPAFADSVQDARRQIVGVCGVDADLLKVATKVEG